VQVYQGFFEMPRKSVFSGISPDKSTLKPPEPPDSLTPDEAEEWRLITTPMPHDYFTSDMFSVLISLCRNTVRIKWLCQRLGEFTPKSLKDATEFDRYARIQDMVVEVDKLILAASTKLRLNPQARYDSARAHRVARNQGRNKGKAGGGELYDA
jgi:hypothetical protein